jgi:hypothetical protein
MECEELTLSKRCQHSYGQVPLYYLVNLVSAFNFIPLVRGNTGCRNHPFAYFCNRCVKTRPCPEKFSEGEAFLPVSNGKSLCFIIGALTCSKSWEPRFTFLVFYFSSVCKTHQSSWEMVANYLLWRFSTISFSTFSLPQMCFSYFSSCTFFNGWYRDVCKQ